MSGQSKLASFFEAKANIIVGMPVNYALNFVMIQALAQPLTDGKHWAYITMSVVFTVASFGRSYLLRRYFNRRTLDAQR